MRVTRLLALLMIPSALAAQARAAASLAPDSLHVRPRLPVRLTTMILLPALGGAAVGQLLGQPGEWARTPAECGRRAADQLGFRTTQLATKGAITALTGWRDDTRPCLRRGLAALSGCAAARTFTSIDASGVQHPNMPLIVGAATAAAVSVAWRPERHARATAWRYGAVRAITVLGSGVWKRALVERRRRERSGGV